MLFGEKLSSLKVVNDRRTLTLVSNHIPHATCANNIVSGQLGVVSQRSRRCLGRIRALFGIVRTKYVLGTYSELIKYVLSTYSVRTNRANAMGMIVFHAGMSAIQAGACNSSDCVSYSRKTVKNRVFAQFYDFATRDFDRMHASSRLPRAKHVG